MPAFFTASSLSDYWKRLRATAPEASQPAAGAVPQGAIGTLAAHGWEAEDVSPRQQSSATWLFARKGAIRCLLALARRDRPLSERSLRELIAGRARLQASHAAVISPAGIATDVRMIAQAADVVVLRVSDLTRLDRALRLR